MHLLPGTLLHGGDYKILSVLGQGGFGITYLGEQAGLGRQVAIKEFFMREHCERDPETSRVSMGSTGARLMVERFRQKFIKEAQIIATLRHPNIIGIHSVFEENNTAYYVMEYIECGSLGNRVGKTGMKQQDAVRYIRQVASALSYLHKKKMNHLDIKPGNILIDEEDNTILIDFGLAKHYDDDGKQTTTTPVGISHGYAPTEQYIAGGVAQFSPATDIYALGATLYKMLTGITPPNANSIAKGLPTDELQARGVSPQLIHAITRAMKFDPDDRPQSVADFLALLDGKEAAADEKTNFGGDLGGGGGNNRGGSTAGEETNLGDNLNGDSNDGGGSNPGGGATTLSSGNQPAYNRSNFIANKLKSLSNFFKGNKKKNTTAQDELRDKQAEKEFSPNELFEKGLEFYNAGNYREAVKWYRMAAEQGNANAQCDLGFCYEEGQGVLQDYAEAVKWYRKSAEQGNANAQCNLGTCYYKGHGVSQDYTEAVKWYRNAAEQGLVRAQYNLGYCYGEGQGVLQDYTEAVKWYRKAAEQGNARAQCNLGFCYEEGQGVSQDHTEAVKWYRKAAEQGNALAQYNLGLCYEKCQGVLQDYTEAVKWYRKAAEQGNALAQCNLGYCYGEGQGVSQDYTEAVKWYRKAAEQGNALAQSNLGYCYEEGQGVSQDYTEAVKWYRKAAEQGNAYGQCNLGTCYYNGHGVDKNLDEAVKWWRKAAEQGDEPAKENLRDLDC